MLTVNAFDSTPGGADDASETSVCTGGAACTLRQAIAAAKLNPGKDIIDFSLSQDETITLDEDMGQLVINEDEVVEEVDIVGPTGYVLTLNANGDDSVTNPRDQRAFLVKKNSQVTIQNLTIIGGYTSAGYNSPDPNGAAISNWGKLTIDNVTFSDNTTTTGGGAIYNQATLNVNSSIFEDNEAGIRGGAIYSIDTIDVIGDTTLGITDTVFERNTVTGGGDGDGGGAIYSIDSFWGPHEEVSATAKLSISDSRFVSNTAPNGSGGAVYLRHGELSVSRSEFEGNQAAPSSIGPDVFAARGGAIYTYNPGLEFAPVTTVIEDSTFVGNSAYRGGAVYFYLDDIVEVTNSTFSANVAHFQGGAIFFSQIEDSVELAFNTITENQASSVGGGLYSQAIQKMPTGPVLSVAPFLHHNIVSANTVGAVSSDFWGEYDDTSTYNFVGSKDPKAVPNIINEDGLFADGSVGNDDPELSGLAYNGGPTRTHKPLAGSPVINGGASSESEVSTGTFPQFDQRGNFFRMSGPKFDFGSLETCPPLTICSPVGPLGGGGSAVIVGDVPSFLAPASVIDSLFAEGRDDDDDDEGDYREVAAETLLASYGTE